MQEFKYVRHLEAEALIDFLCRRFPYHNRQRWLEAIQVGTLVINGQLSHPQYLLQTKDVVGYRREREEEPPIEKDHRILYQDEVILVVEKNGCIPISESGKYYKNTLLEVLKAEHHLPLLHAVHRLDKETSGLLVVAKSKEIATLLGQQFAARSPKKRYHAVLQGEMAQAEFLLDAPIGKVTPAESQIRIRQLVTERGKASKTLFRRLWAGQGLSLAEVTTFTGRTHQIRCHAHHLGHPLLGDKLYGQTDQDFIDLLEGRKEPTFGPYGPIDRQLLHASGLEFEHPVDGRILYFESDPHPFFTKFNLPSGLLESCRLAVQDGEKELTEQSDQG